MRPATLAGMKTALAAVILAILTLHPAEARRARHVDMAPVPVAGAMVDDRYPHMRLPEAYGTARAQQPQARAHHRHKHRRHAVRAKPQPAPLVSIPLPTPRPVQADPEKRTSESRTSIAQGFAREVVRAFPSGRPAGCPARAWCGCWLGHHLGIVSRNLWLAANWRFVGRPADGPRVGAIVVWRHHVGRITAVNGVHIRVLSGNDGRAVRDRWRTTRGVIAYRSLGAGT